MSTTMPSFMSSIRKLSPKGWAMAGGALAAGIVFLVVIMHFASSPSYATLQTGLDPAQTGKITAALSTQGIAYKLQNNGTALAVESSKTAQARVALATAGLLSNQQPGFALLDKQKLGQSNFQQQVTYTRALEGQLASTIETIDGISGAQVNLVLPNAQDQLFSDQTQPSTASVLLSGSDQLQGSSVRGIAQLVASSVPGLQLNKVTVTGADGSLLWPNGSGSDGDSSLPAKEQLQQRYDTAMAASAGAMLTQTLGAGKAQVVVNADLDANRATQDKLQYAKKGTPITQQTGNEQLKGGGAGAGGAAGTTSNIPAVSGAGGSGGANSNYRNRTADTTFGVDKTVTHSVIAPGAVQRQTVSVLVDKSVPAASIPAIRKAVSNAVGLQPGRDQLSVSQLAFAPVKATPAVAKPNPMMHYAKYGVLGLGAVAFLFFSMRAVRKRERESFGEPTWLTEAATPRPLASLEAGRQAEVTALQPHVGVARRQVEDLVNREPDRVAAHLRNWMAED